MARSRSARAGQARRSWRPARRTIVAAAAAGVAAVLVVAQTLVQLTQRNRPALALALQPGNPVANAALADSRWIADSASPSSQRAAAALARRSLDAQLFNPRALYVLGYIAYLDGQNGRARSLLTLSERMYRRDLTVQLWLIEDSVRAGRVDQALSHYDTALRTSRNAGEILFPVLASAIGEPAIRRGLAPYLRGNAPWVVPFVRYSIESGTNVKIMAQILVQYGQVAAASLQTQMLGALVASGDYAAAARFYLAMPGARLGGLRSVGFGGGDVDPGFLPVSWRASVTDSASVGLESGGHAGRRFRISMPAEETGPVLQKTLWLTPGTYSLASTQQFVERGADADVRWTVDCLRAPAASQRLVSIYAGAARSSGQFAVPAGCTAQSIGLAVSSGANDAGIEMLVEKVTLLPAD